METEISGNNDAATPNDVISDATKRAYRESLTLSTLNEYEDDEKIDPEGPNRILAVLVPLTAYIRAPPVHRPESTLSNGVSITTLEDFGSLTSAHSLRTLDNQPVSRPYSLNSLGNRETSPIDIESTEGVKFVGVPESDDDDSSVTEEESKTESSKIPDGGWGWMVVLAAFFINMAGDGIAFSFGLLYIEFLNEFGASKSKTAWIGSLFMAVPLILGPVASAFVEKFGCRSMTIVAGIISGIGFVLSCFSTNIVHMYLTFGILAGVGLALSYVTAVVSIAFWFEKRRGLACSLGSTGTGFGTIVYSRITSFLIYEYGWRGTVLLLSGTFFNLCVCGAIMRDPAWWTLEQLKDKELKSIKGTSLCGSVSGYSEDDMPDIEELKQMLESGTPTFRGHHLEQNNVTADICKFSSVLNIPTFIETNEKLPLEVIDKISKNKRLYNVIFENYPKLLADKTYSSDLHYNTIQPNCKVANEMKQNIIKSKQAEDKIPLHTESFEEDDAVRESPIHVAPTNGGIETLNQVNAHLVQNDVRNNIADNVIKNETNPPEDVVPPDLKEQILTKTQKLKELRKEQSTDNDKVVPSTGAVVAANAKPPVNAERGKSMSPPGTGQLGRPYRSDSKPWLRRQFSFKEQPVHYLKHLKVHRNSVMYRGATLTTPSYRLRASSCPNIYKNSITTIAKDCESGWVADVRELFIGMFDFSMFLELHFLLVSVSTVLLFTWFVIPYFYLTDFVTNKGLTMEEATSIMSYTGVTNTIGMVALGYACDQPWLNVKKVYAACLIGCGISVAVMPLFASNYWALLITCLAFGIFFASNFSCTPVILVELVPLDRFATAYGLTLLAQGIGNLVGPPLAGMLFDITGEWICSFLMAGFWIVIAGLLIAIIPYTENRIIWGEGVLEKDREEIV